MKQLLAPGVVQIIQVANRHGLSQRASKPWTGADFQSSFDNGNVTPDGHEALFASATTVTQPAQYQYGNSLYLGNQPYYDTPGQYVVDLGNGINDDVRLGNVNGLTGGRLFNGVVRNSALTLKTLL